MNKFSDNDEALYESYKAYTIFISRYHSFTLWLDLENFGDNYATTTPTSGEHVPYNTGDGERENQEK